MKRVTLGLVILLAVVSFGGSFSCHSGDVDVHSNPQTPTKPSK